MNTNTGIEWCDATYNPTRGCSRVSPGCENCYAERVAARFSTATVDGTIGGDIVEFDGPFTGFARSTTDGPRWTGHVELIESKLTEPLHRRRWAEKFLHELGRKPRVFVDSMSDLFHKKLHDKQIAQPFAVAALADWFDYIILTKRAGRLPVIGDPEFREFVAVAAQTLSKSVRPFALPSEDVFDARRVARGESWQINAWPLANVRLGVSVEDQQRADARLPHLMQVAAMGWKTFVSAEPLLAKIDLMPWLRPEVEDAGLQTSLRLPQVWPQAESSHAGIRTRDNGRSSQVPRLPSALRADDHADCDSAGMGALGVDHGSGTARQVGTVGWIIIGGESGPGARPCELAWIRSLRDQAKAAGVKTFIKQLGSNVRDRNDAGFDADSHVLADGPNEGQPVNPSAWPDRIEAEGRVEDNPNGWREEYQGAPVRVHLRHPRGADPSEWPADLRIRGRLIP